MKKINKIKYKQINKNKTKNKKKKKKKKKIFANRRAEMFLSG